MSRYVVKGNAFIRIVGSLAMFVVAIIAGIAVSAQVHPVVGILTALVFMAINIIGGMNESKGIVIDSDQDFVGHPYGWANLLYKKIPFSQITSVSVHQQSQMKKAGDSYVKVFTDLVTIAGPFGSTVIKFATGKGRTEEFLAKLEAARNESN